MRIKLFSGLIALAVLMVGAAIAADPAEGAARTFFSPEVLVHSAMAIVVVMLVHALIRNYEARLIEARENVQTLSKHASAAEKEREFFVALIPDFQAKMDDLAKRDVAMLRHIDAQKRATDEMYGKIFQFTGQVQSSAQKVEKAMELFNKTAGVAK